MMRLIPSQFLLLGLFVFALVASTNRANAQCTANLTTNNLVTNGDFSDGYNGWTYDNTVYTQYVPCGTTNCWSGQGDIYIGGNPNTFNQGGFPSFADHTPGADTNMYMVDVACVQPGDAPYVVWEQTITLPNVANTNYYFSAWFTELSNQANVSTLRFNINGSLLGPTVTTSGPDDWQQVTANWNSGATPPATVTLQLVSTNTTNCQTGRDFAIDDITFTANCGPVAPGPQPDLGADLTLCGTGGSVLINTGITPHADIQVIWSDGPNGIGLGAPHSRTISTPGTYTVCVDSAGSCVRSDVIEIFNSFNIDLGSDIVLCDPVTADLDAFFNGPGITYQWFLNASPITGATNQTYTANMPGTYRVEVTDPGCGTDFDEVAISTLAASPNNQDYCPPTNPTLSVSGSGEYKWWTESTPGGIIVGTGPSITPAITGDTVFYVEDTSTFNATVGPESYLNPTPYSNPFSEKYNVNAGSDDGRLQFNVSRDMVLDSIMVYVNNYYCPSPGIASDNIRIRVFNGFSGFDQTVDYSAPCQFQNNGAAPGVPTWVPLNLTLPAGNGYFMELASGSGNTINGWWNGTGSGGAPPTTRRYQYPTDYSGIVTFQANDPGFNPYFSPDAFPGYFDWHITVGTPCAAVPVHATEDCPLPVELVNFTASPSGALEATLLWTTASEFNNDYFEVQRSLDGQTWTTVGVVSGNGTSSATTNYVFVDNVPEAALYYYQLNQVDLDGTSTFSEVRAVQFESHGAITLGPNPASIGDPIWLRGQNLVSVTVYDMLGREFFRESTPLGIDELEVSTANWGRGMYVVKATALDGTGKTFKLLLD